MNQEQFIKDLLAAAQESGIAEAEVYFQQADALKVFVNKGEIEDYAVNTSCGLSLRGLVDGKMGTAYTEILDKDAITLLVKGVLTSAALINDVDEQFIFAGSPAYAAVDTTGDPGSLDAQIDFALELDRQGRSLDPKVRELGFTMYESECATIRLVNTHGLDLSHTINTSAAYVEAIAREGGRVTTATGIEAAYSLSGLDAKKIAREAVEQAVFLLGASPCESGERPVIFRNDAMASLLAVFSGIFSADAAQKGLSLLKGKEGKTIAAPCVTLVDDPLWEGGFGSRAFDAEGVATKPKAIVEAGVLKTLLHNLKTAKKAGCESTGNAARAGYTGGITVAPFNLLLRPGDMDLDALMEEAGESIVITSLEGLHAGADAISGDFSLLSKGYLIEGGKKGRAVEQITVAGNFFAMLQDVAAVGGDMRQFPSCISCPSVLVRSLSIAGK